MKIILRAMISIALIMMVSSNNGVVSAGNPSKEITSKLAESPENMKDYNITLSNFCDKDIHVEISADGKSILTLTAKALDKRSTNPGVTNANVKLPAKRLELAVIETSEKESATILIEPAKGKFIKIDYAVPGFIKATGKKISIVQMDSKIRLIRLLSSDKNTCSRSVRAIRTYEKGKAIGYSFSSTAA
jgi:hypothetical protein